MKRTVLSLAAVAAIGLFVAVAAGAAGLQRSDCPGKVVCPLTGDEVCKDQCPLLDAQRDDCPGKIECPIDGNLVSRGECPLEAAENKATQPESNCCRKSS